jgi:hypothetical protein
MKANPKPEGIIQLTNILREARGGIAQYVCMNAVRQNDDGR